MKAHGFLTIAILTTAISCLGETWQDPKTGIVWHYTTTNGVVTLGNTRDERAIDTSFEGTLELPAVVNGDPVVDIAPWAFYECYGLTNVIVSSGVTNIGDHAFRYCSYLVSIKLPNTIRTIGDCAFGACLLLSDVSLPDGLVSLGDSSFSNSNLKSIVLPESLTSIGANTFCYSRFDTITIPANIEHIGLGAFESCTLLTQIDVNEGNAYYKSVDGVLYDKSGKNLICYPYAKGSEFVVPTCVTNIADRAFALCEDLRSVVITNGTKRIGSYAFVGCSQLVSVSLSDGLEEIGEAAFEWCGKLKSIRIPNSVTLVDRNALSFCEALECVVFDGEPPFGERGLPIDENVRTLFDEQYRWAWNDVIAEYGLVNASSSYTETIDGIEWTCTYESGHFAVTDAVSTNADSVVETVTVPSVMYEIEVAGISGMGSGFSNLSGLKSIIFPASIKTIQSGVFSECETLSDITFEGNAPRNSADVFDGFYSDLVIHANATSTGWVRWNDQPVVFDVGSSNVVQPTVVLCSNLVVTVTNVVVHYILNSIVPEIAVPVSGSTGFVNVITEVNGGSGVAIPSEWQANYPDFAEKFGSDFGKALMKTTGKRDGMGNPMLVWQDFVAGTDPTDENDQFTASITIVDGVPVISYTPELTAEQAALRVYKTYGKIKLTDTAWTDITAKTSEERANYNFFKVTVEMK